MSYRRVRSNTVALAHGRRHTGQIFQVQTFSPFGQEHNSEAFTNLRMLHTHGYLPTQI